VRPQLSDTLIEICAKSAPIGQRGQVPKTVPSAGPYVADDWAQISKGEVRFRAAAAKTILPTAGDPAIGSIFDPVFGPGAIAVSGNHSGRRGILRTPDPRSRWRRAIPRPSGTRSH